MRNTFAHAYVNSAFSVTMGDGGDDEKKSKIEDVRIAFGGVGRDDEPGTHASLAKNVQEFLFGRPLKQATLEETMNLLCC